MSDGLIAAILAFLLALFGLSLDQATRDQPRPQTQPGFEFHKPDLATDDLRDALRSFREDLKDSIEEKQRHLRERIDALTPDEKAGGAFVEPDSAQGCTRDERSGEGWLTSLIRCHSSSSSSDGATSTSNSIVITSSSSSSSGFNVDSTKR